MAGPSIMVRVLGDLTGLSKATDGAAKKGSDAAATIHSGFSSMLAAVNKTGVLGPFGEALDGIDETISTIIENGKKIGPSITAAGTAVAGIGLGLSALGSKDQAAHQQLQAAVQATGGSYDDYEKQVDAAVKTQEKFGDSASTTQDALAALVEATHNPTEALKLLSTATDVAAAKHENLQQAAVDVGKVYNGNTKLLKEFGITVTKTSDLQKEVTKDTTKAQSADDALAHAKRTLADIEEVDAGKKKLTVGQAIQLRNAEEAVTTAAAKSKTAHKNLSDAQDAAKKSAGKQTDATTLLANVTKGQASAAADTFTGKINAVKAKVEDTASSFGQKYGPALTTAGTVTAGLGGAFQAAQGVMGHFQKASEDAKDAVKDVSAAENGAQDASSLLAGASGIGLILVAIAALILIGYEIYKHWNTIWSGMKAIIKDVWDWIKANWPLLLGIITGPIGLAVVEIVKHWKTIEQGFKDAIAAIKGAWNAFVGWFEGLGAAIARYAAGMWHGIIDAFHTVIGGVKAAWAAVWAWFTGLPGAIGRVAVGMWDGIADAFRSMVNKIIDIWNGLHFQLPKINEGPIHIGGETIGVPHIPHLAQGGLMTSSGIVYAHAGEVITPAPASTRSTSFTFPGAVFNSGVDVELFMKKAAWVAQTARI